MLSANTNNDTSITMYMRNGTTAFHTVWGFTAYHPVAIGPLLEN